MKWRDRELNDVEISAVFWQARVVVEESRKQSKLMSRIDTANLQILLDLLIGCGLCVCVPQHLVVADDMVEYAKHETLTYDEQVEHELAVSEADDEIRLRNYSKGILFRSLSVAVSLLSDANISIPVDLGDGKPIQYRGNPSGDNLDRDLCWGEYCLAMAEASKKHIYLSVDETGKMTHDPLTGRKLPEIE